jgi:hypothetical protein
MMKDPTDLLYKAKAVNPTSKQAYPWHVYMNVKDYEKLVANVRSQARKERPYASAETIDMVVGSHMLMFGPVRKQDVQEGYVLVDHASIEKEDRS